MNIFEKIYFVLNLIGIILIVRYTVIELKLNEKQDKVKQLKKKIVLSFLIAFNHTLFIIFGIMLQRDNSLLKAMLLIIMCMCNAYFKNELLKKEQQR